MIKRIPLFLLIGWPFPCHYSAESKPVALRAFPLLSGRLKAMNSFFISWQIPMGTVPYLAEQEQLDGECQAQARIIGIV